MFCRIVEKKEARFYVLTETKRILWLYGGPADLSMGDFIETSTILFDNKYEDEFVLFHRKLSIIPDFLFQEFPHFITPCDGCIFRLKKLTQGCNPCTPKNV